MCAFQPPSAGTRCPALWRRLLQGQGWCTRLTRRRWPAAAPPAAAGLIFTSCLASTRLLPCGATSTLTQLWQPARSRRGWTHWQRQAGAAVGGAALPGGTCSIVCAGASCTVLPLPLPLSLPLQVDVHASTTQLWQQPGHFPGEPVFVARPGGQQEDDGVLLSVVLAGGWPPPAML